MKYLIVDGNSMVHRAFHGISPLFNRNNIPTNAIYGFFNMLFKAQKEIKADETIIAFDLHEPTFRHKAFAGYKAQRTETPEELSTQFPLIRKILKVMGISVATCPGYEADDVLGTLSRLCEESQNECVIVTGDKDLLQLLGTYTKVRLYRTTAKIIDYTPEVFREDFGLEPLQLIDLKGVVGDASDNYKGIFGVGEKTMVPFLQEWGSLETFYENIDSIRLTPKLRERFVKGKENAFFCKMLATIVRDVPISQNLADFHKKEENLEELAFMLSDLELNQLLKTLKLKPIPLSEIQARESMADKLEAYVEEILEEIDGFSESVWDKLCNQDSTFLFDGNCLEVYDGTKIYRSYNEFEIMDYLKGQGNKQCFDAKLSYKWMLKRGRKIHPVTEDALISAYLLCSDTEKYELEKLCVTYNIVYKEEHRVACLALLCNRLKKIIKNNGMESLLYDMELPLTIVLANMEHYGVQTNREDIQSFGESIAKKIAELEQRIFEVAGHEFLISSPKQLATVLFEEMKLPTAQKKKNGYSTNADVLEELRGQSPIIEDIMEWRTLFKLQTTYVEGFLNKIDRDGRIHTTYLQTETRTGRISSVEPNMQNIPVRTEIGSQMRKFFIAKEGYTLIDADYSQIELRVLAHLSEDKTMCQCFQQGEDIHTSTAKEIFNMPAELITDEMRRSAKAVNFGIVYGMGAFSLSENIDVSYYEAERYINEYKSKFPRVEKFMSNTVRHAMNDGYVTTMFGRRRTISELKSVNKNTQNSGKRIAMNTMVQGTAADLIKLAMIRVQKSLAEKCPKAKLILQIHDELIIETPKEYAKLCCEILKYEMEHVASLRVPLVVDAQIGDSWYDAKG